jgi:hypothetical protein
MRLKKISQKRNRTPLKKTFRGVARKRRIRSLEDITYLSNRGLIAEAAAIAIKKQLKNGVPAVWMEKGNIYRIHPDGSREKIAKHSGSTHKMNKENFIIQIK